MKITNFNTGFNNNNQYGKPVKGTEPQPNHIPALKKASGGEDFVEISREAIIKHREAKIVNFTEVLIKKEAAKSLPDSKELKDGNPEKTSNVREMVSAGKYNFDDESVISETAERVMMFLG